MTWDQVLGLVTLALLIGLNAGYWLATIDGAARILKVRAQEGDVLVIEVERPLTSRQLQFIYESIGRIGLKVPVILMDEGMKVKVMQGASIPELRDARTKAHTN